MMVVFLGVSGCAWLSIKLGPVFGPLGMAGVFLVIAIVAALASVVLRRRTKQRAFLEQTTRAPSAVALVNPAVLNIAMQAARTLGWRRLVPLALLGILAAQLAQAPHRRGPDQSVKSKRHGSSRFQWPRNIGPDAGVGRPIRVGAK